MKAESKRKLQLLVAVAIYVAAALLSYFSIVEASGYSVYLVLDVSGSMSSSDKIGSLKNASRTFVSTLNLTANPSMAVGIITFETNVQIQSHLTSNENNLYSVIESLRAGGQTSMGDAMKTGVDQLKQEGSGVPVIVLMTDGLSNDDQTINAIPAANYAAKKKVAIYSVGFGGDADTGTLQIVADRTGGKYYFAPSGSELVEIFEEIATSLSISPIMHYGSRLLMLTALPLLLFLPEIQKGATTVYKTILTTVLKKPIEVRGVRCQECGHLNRPAARFCGACRTPLITVGRPCPKCEYVNRFGATFCGRCGMRLENKEE